MAILLRNFIGNNGDNIFTEQTHRLSILVAGSAAWGDYDNDGNFDILLTGYSGEIRFHIGILSQ